MSKCEFRKEKNVHFCKKGFRILFYANQGEIKKNIVRVIISFKLSYNKLKSQAKTPGSIYAKHNPS